MKIKLLIVTAFLLIGAHSANAQMMFGWHGSVTFTNGVNTFGVNFSGPTYLDCEAQRGLTKSMYSPPIYSVVSETPCVSLFIDPKTLLTIPKFTFPWPDPGCLSCPYLIKDIIELIYPRDVEKVIQIMGEYRIDEYNQALEKLNSQYDLEGFVEQMYLFENEMARGAQQH